MFLHCDRSVFHTFLYTTFVLTNFYHILWWHYRHCYHVLGGHNYMVSLWTLNSKRLKSYHQTKGAHLSSQYNRTHAKHLIQLHRKAFLNFMKLGKIISSHQYYTYEYSISFQFEHHLFISISARKFWRTLNCLKESFRLNHSHLRKQMQGDSLLNWGLMGLLSQNSSVKFETAQPDFHFRPSRWTC